MYVITKIISKQSSGEDAVVENFFLRRTYRIFLIRKDTKNLRVNRDKHYK